MTLFRIALVALSLTAGAAAARAAAPATPEEKLEAAQSAFVEAEFNKALRQLNAAAASTTDGALLGRIHLLRGRCHAALQDEGKAAEAFSRALESDPEVSLDPARVQPSVVDLLERQRQTIRAKVIVQSEPSGAQAYADGQSLGQTPVETTLAVGRHQLEVRAADGRVLKSETVVLHANETHLLTAQDSAPPPPPPVANEDAGEGGFSLPGRLLGDLRLMAHPFEGMAAELGAGLSGERFAASLHATVGPFFGLTLRGGYAFPRLQGPVGAYVSASLPLAFVEGSTGLGLGAAGGVTYEATDWLVPFVELDVRHYFGFTSGLQASYLLVGAGARVLFR